MPETIEAEIIEINGAPPPETPPEPQPRFAGADWSAWKSRALTLDRRWWPLWVLAGLMVAGIVLVFGVLAGLVWMALQILRGIGRLFFGGAPAPRAGSLRRSGMP